jgi:hypothetical protein
MHPSPEYPSIHRQAGWKRFSEREFWTDHLLVRIYLIIVMIRRTGLATWECEFSFPGSIPHTFLVEAVLTSLVLENVGQCSWVGTSVVHAFQGFIRFA